MNCIGHTSVARLLNSCFNLHIYFPNKKLLKTGSDVKIKCELLYDHIKKAIIDRKVD